MARFDLGAVGQAANRNTSQGAWQLFIRGVGPLEHAFVAGTPPGSGSGGTAWVRGCMGCWYHPPRRIKTSHAGASGAAVQPHPGTRGIPRRNISASSRVVQRPAKHVVPKATHHKRGHAHPEQPAAPKASPVKWAELAQMRVGPGRAGMRQVQRPDDSDGRGGEPSSDCAVPGAHRADHRAPRVAA